MDTVMELTAFGPNGGDALDEAQTVISRLEGLLSATGPDSEIYAANHSDGGAVSLSEETAEVVSRALELCADTGGALDVSIYPLVQAWGFTTGSFAVPDEETIAALLSQVDYTRIQLDGTQLTVPSGMEIDLGAVAKGYTGDCILALFRERGLTSAMLSLGGNVQVLGAKPDGSRWNVAIQDPFGEGYAAVVSAENQAVVTSGGYQRYFEEDGVRYWHILDPATGAPARKGLVSVTIVCDSGVLADCLSTALFVMGKDQAADYWRSRQDFDFVLIGEDGSVSISQGLQDTFSLYGDWAGQDVEVVS
jgi:thiamine biosynthesis lipoprotein